jgi:hypothetical protein
MWGIGYTSNMSLFRWFRAGWIIGAGARAPRDRSKYVSRASTRDCGNVVLLLDMAARGSRDECQEEKGKEGNSPYLL